MFVPDGLTVASEVNWNICLQESLFFPLSTVKSQERGNLKGKKLVDNNCCTLARHYRRKWGPKPTLPTRLYQVPNTTMV
jgi:hypothetical protein